jgi:hypothetical protein
MKKSIIIILTLFLFINSYGQTASAFVAKSVAMDQVIQNGLNKFDGILDKQQRELFVNASNLTSIMKTQFSDLYKDLERNLTRKQIEVFNDLTRLELELTKVISGEITKISEVALDLQNTVTRLPFVKKFPTTTNISIPIFTHQQEGVYSIKLKGINLNNENNYIILNGKKYNNPIIPSVKENEFRIPLTKSEIFNDSINVMEIVLFKKNFWGKNKEYKYTALYNVLPQNIAKIKVFYQTIGKKRVYTNELTQQVAKTPGNCRWSENEKNVNRRNTNRKIDLSTVRIIETRQARGGGECSWDRNKSTEFSISARATARKCCNWGGVNCGTGRTECDVKWKEYEEVDDFQAKDFTHNLLYNSQEVIELPQNTFKFTKVTIDFFNGKSITIDEPIFEKNFVKFKYDAGRKQVFLAFAPSL